MAKLFNTAGMCDPRFHYMLPAAERLPEVRKLVDEGQYFALHAPRQTGKSTTLREWSRQLTAEGRYTALFFSCETAEPAQNDFGAAELIILSSMRGRAGLALPPQCRPPDPWPAAAAGERIATGLRAWAQQSPRPLALFFDEIDAVQGESLRSVLRQLRLMHGDRPDGGPWSVALCGLRDVRDYKAASGGDPTRLGTSSPFNVKVSSLRLGDFSREDVAALYAQHTRETGQPFTETAIGAVMEATAGQPWLVNAIAREVVEELNLAPPTPIDAGHIREAKERLILARATHLDSLVSKLNEPRVRKVIEPIMSGDVLETTDGGTYSDDLLYVRDLGLVAPKPPTRIANAIYREVIARVLADEVQERLDIEPRSFVLPDGRFDLSKMLHEFAAFWVQHGDVFAAKMPYAEVAPQLVMMAFLQRVVNGGGYVEREYGVGRGRIDLLIRWPLPGNAWQHEALELKVWRDRKSDPLEEGLKQLQGYVDWLGVRKGTLVIFDRRTSALPIDQRTRFETAVLPNGETITVLRG